MALPSFCVFNRKCSIIMFTKCLVLPTFINQSLRLKAVPPATCIRKYTMTYDEEEREKKIKNRVIKVNVIMPDQKVSSMTMEQAQKMAKRRDLTMTRIIDPPKFASFAGRDVYEMFTKSQHIKQTAESCEVAAETEFKEKKTITFSTTIATHDMSNKLKQIKKWLSKHHVVVIIIADDGTGQCMKEKVTFVQAECQEVCKITTVAKKKQTILTLVPIIDKPNSKQEPTIAQDPA